MESRATECWFCRQPIHAGERATHSPHGRIAVHTACLRHDALEDVFTSRTPAGYAPEIPARG
jgi:hypothetical protein